MRRPLLKLGKKLEYVVQQSLNGLVLGAVYGLFALGFGLVLANLKIFSMAHEGVFAWSALATYFLMSVLKLPIILSYIGALAAGTCLSVITYLVLIKHLHKRRNADMMGFISSIGGLLVLTQMGDISLGGGGVSVRLPFDSFPIHVWHFGAIQISSIELLMALAAFFGFATLAYVMERTQLGREVKAVAFDRELGGLLGVNVERVTVLVFAIAGFLAAMAAILFSIAFNVINPEIGRSYSVLAIAITVVGGYGNLVGTIVTALAVGLLSTLVGAYWTSAYEQVIIYLVFLLVLALKPRGIFGQT